MYPKRGYRPSIFKWQLVPCCRNVVLNWNFFYPPLSRIDSKSWKTLKQSFRLYAILINDDFYDMLKAYHLLRVLRFPIHVDHLLIGCNEKYRTINTKMPNGLTDNKSFRIYRGTSLVTYAFGTWPRYPPELTTLPTIYVLWVTVQYHKRFDHWVLLLCRFIIGIHFIHFETHTGTNDTAWK